jgi:hypothetical protein
LHSALDWGIVTIETNVQLVGNGGLEAAEP